MHISLIVVASLLSSSPLADAAERGNSAAVRSLLQAGVDVDKTQADGMTALLWAARREDVGTAKLLVERKASVDKANVYGVRPLLVACEAGNQDLASLLLLAGADPNAPGPDGASPLMIAARTGKIGAIKALLDAHAEVDRREGRGQTALMWAAAEGNADAVSLLLKAGADPAVTLDSGFDALAFAVREGRTETAKRLIAAGADVMKPMKPARPGGKAPSKGTAPLILAVENGHFSLASELLKLGADPNDMRSGFGPLHVLTWVRKANRGDGDDGDPEPVGSGTTTSLQMAERLIEAGADVDLRLTQGGGGRGVLNRAGATPLLLAAMRADLPLIKLLVDHRADPNAANVDGCTPLMAAAGVGCLAPGEEAGTEEEAVKTLDYLLGLGADVDARDKNGETAMHGAAYKSLPKVVERLSERGAKVEVWNRKNKYGWTPTMIAEGHRPGNFKPDPATLDALRKALKAAGEEPAAGSASVKAVTDFPPAP